MTIDRTVAAELIRAEGTWMIRITHEGHWVSFKIDNLDEVLKPAFRLLWERANPGWQTDRLAKYKRLGPLGEKEKAGTLTDAEKLEAADLMDELKRETERVNDWTPTPEVPNTASDLMTQNVAGSA